MSSRYCLLMCLVSTCLVTSLPTLARKISPSKSRWLFDQLKPAEDHEVTDDDRMIDETPGARFDPPLDRIKVWELKRKLGSQFDPEFMSIGRPAESHLHPNGVVSFPYRKNKHGKIRPQNHVQTPEIDAIDLHNLVLPDGTIEQTHIGEKLERKFRKLLWAFTYCPVLYRWKDLGIRFWPRWIKTGSCSGKKSCSFPAGMKCQPKKDAMHVKMILRWHCRDWETSDTCRWIPVRYPIIAECECGCRKTGRKGRKSWFLPPFLFLMRKVCHFCFVTRCETKDAASSYFFFRGVRIFACFLKRSGSLFLSL